MINNFELQELEKYIICLEYPTIFLFKLLKYNIDDNNISYILRIFLKHHYNYACSNNIASIFNNNEYPKTIKIFENFYNLIKNKIILLLTINKFIEKYDNKDFWDMQLNDQILFLKKTKHYFNSVFDCANGGLPFYYRINLLLNNMYRDEMMINIEERLLIILGIFDKKIFNYLEIPLIHVSDFYNLSSKDIIQYLSIIFTKFTKLLNNMINLFQEYFFISDRLILLYSPIINEESSESEVDEDIELFC
jgi:hypothetical protein